MKIREKQNGRRHLGIRRAAVLGAGLATLAAAQPATTLDADMQRAYAQAGRVGGSVGITRPWNQLQVKDGVAAYATEDSVFVQPLRVACTLPVCGWVCAAQAVRTIAFPLPSGRSATVPALGLLRVEYPGNGSFTVVLALSMPVSKVERIEVRVDAEGHVGYRNSGPLALNPLASREIRAFADLEGKTADIAPPFLALGMQGTLYRIETTSLGLQEVALVSRTGDDFQCQGEGWVGTSQGRIWRIRSGFTAPYLEEVQTPAPGGIITRIDAYIARLGPDRYLLNRGTHWTGPQAAVAGLIGASPRWKAGGTWLELWTERGERSVEFGDDAETIRYRRDGGAWTADSVRPTRYEGAGKRVYEISLRDPDRNMRAPSVSFGSYDTYRPRFLQGVQADPEVGCAATGWCLPGDEGLITLTLGPDSVSISMPVLEGRREIDPACKTPVFVGARKTLTLSEPWARGNWIAIGKGLSSPGGGLGLFFAYGSTAGVRPGGMPKPLASSLRRGPGMRAVWERGAGEAVDAGGRRITMQAGSSGSRPVPR